MRTIFLILIIFFKLSELFMKYKHIQFYRVMYVGVILSVDEVEMLRNYESVVLKKAGTA